MDLHILNANKFHKEMLEFNTADLLKCGSCSSEFLLSDILVFIQHKTKSCKLEKSTSFENKENFLKCSNCPESFGNAKSLLQHAQFIHKIDIFLDSSGGGSSSKAFGVSNDKNNMHHNHQSSTSKYLSSNQATVIENAKSSPSSKNQIFIDVIPSSDLNSRYADRNESYNITFSSSTTSASFASSEPKKTNGSSGATDNRGHFEKSKFRLGNKMFANANTHADNQVNGSKETRYMMIDQNENTSSSSSTDSSVTIVQHRFEEQITNKDSNSSMNDSTDNKSSNLNENKIDSLEDYKQKQQHKASTTNMGTATKPTALFNCDVCKISFNQKIHLTKHSAKHTGIKPFKCTECNYSTVERSHLKVHVRVHTGEKPFKCTFCEYATAQSSTLKIHKKRHHQKNEEKECGETNEASMNLMCALNSEKSREDLGSVSKMSDLNEVNSKNDVLVKANYNPITSNIGMMQKPENEEKRNFNFDFLYRDKKSLPPTKRFKNNYQDDMENSSMPLASSSLQQAAIIGLVKADDDNNEQTSSTCQIIEQKAKPAGENNKLLGLAKIALEERDSTDTNGNC